MEGEEEEEGCCSCGQEVWIERRMLDEQVDDPRLTRDTVEDIANLNTLDGNKRDGVSLGGISYLKPAAILFFRCQNVKCHTTGFFNCLRLGMKVCDEQ